MKVSLEGKRILLTRAAEDAATWAEELRTRGALVCAFACLETHTLDESAEALRAGLERATWIAFSSRRAVAALAELSPAPWPRAVRLACVGPATAQRCAELLAAPELTSSGGTASSLARELRALCEDHDHVLLPAAREGRRDFEQSFPAEMLTRVAVYETVLPPEASPRAEPAPAHDVVFFASPSAVAGFAARAGAPDAGALLVALGPATLSELEARNWGPRVVAATRNLEGLVQATLDHWGLSEALPHEP